MVKAAGSSAETVSPELERRGGYQTSVGHNRVDEAREVKGRWRSRAAPSCLSRSQQELKPFADVEEHGGETFQEFRTCPSCLLSSYGYFYLQMQCRGRGCVTLVRNQRGHRFLRHSPTSVTLAMPFLLDFISSPVKRSRQESAIQCVAVEMG